jgi:hypothetical protein
VFVVTVGSMGNPKDLNPDQKRIRDETLATFDFESLAALLRKSLRRCRAAGRKDSS